MRKLVRAVLVVLAGAILSGVSASAQWVMVARAVSGQIQQMSHKGQNGSGGYDVATVMLEANADKAEQLGQQLVGGSQKVEAGYVDRASYRDIIGTRVAREIILEPKK